MLFLLVKREKFQKIDKDMYDVRQTWRALYLSIR